MNIKEILKKIAEGKELTEAEKSFVAGYDPESEENRIPKSRLDKEIAKREAAETKVADLSSKLEEVNTRLEDLEGKGMSEAEKLKKDHDKEVAGLKKQIETLTADRDKAQGDLAKSERTSQIGKIASKHGFSNSEYLDFLAASKEIDLKDEAAVTGFMKELEKGSPELFKSNAKPGSGTKNGSGVPEGSDAAKRLKELMEKKELSLAEAGEVAKLQGEIKSSEASSGKNQGE